MQINKLNANMCHKNPVVQISNKILQILNRILGTTDER